MKHNMLKLKKIKNYILKRANYEQKFGVERFG